VGPSHKTASLAARERFALVGAAATQLTAELHGHPDVLEVAGVATCNRSELYLVVTDVQATLPVVVAEFARLAAADPVELSTMLAVRSERQAVEHMLRVAAGVESVVIGEPQIQGQLKQARERAQDAGTCGPLLDRLFRAALEAGKRVRTETRVGAGRASVGSVAADLVASRLGTLEGRRVLVVGAGKMGELAVRSLRARGVEEVVVANRSPDRAARLAERCQTDAVTFEQLDQLLARVDAVVTSTNAPHAVIGIERMREVMARRGGRPLVLVDLAVPRDVDPAVGDVPGCHLFDLDDLEHVVAETMQLRGRELEAVETIIRQVADEFVQWRASRPAVPAIVELREAAEALRRAEFERFERRTPHLAPEDRRRVEQLTRSIVNRLLHAPTEQLRQRAERGEQALAGQSVHELLMRDPGGS
jgi:glutamyl-tRNA reductase